MDTAKFGQWSFVILRTPRIHEHLTPDSRVWIAARKESTSSKEKDYLHLLHTYFCRVKEVIHLAYLNYEYTHLPSRTTHHTHIRSSPQLDCTTESRLNTTPLQSSVGNPAILMI